MERLYELCKWSRQSNAIIGLQILKMENFREVCIADRLCSQVYEIFIITFIIYDFIFISLVPLDTNQLQYFL